MRSTNSLSYRVLVEMKRLVLPVFFTWSSSSTEHHVLHIQELPGHFGPPGTAFQRCFPRLSSSGAGWRVHVLSGVGLSGCSVTMWHIFLVAFYCSSAGPTWPAGWRPSVLWWSPSATVIFAAVSVCLFCIINMQPEISTQEAFIRIGFAHSFIIVWSLTLLGCHAALWCLPHGHCNYALLQAE